MSDPLQDLLARLGQEGQRESTGTFSLDLLRARAKLSRFALSHPGMWVLKLIQAANCVQAPWVRLELDTQFRLSFPCQTPNALEDLLQAFLPGQASLVSPAAREMSLGLGAVVDRIELLRLEYSRKDVPSKGFVLELRGDGQRVLDPVLPERRGYPAYCSISMRGRHWSLYASEREALRWRCAFSPAMVLVNEVALGFHNSSPHDLPGSLGPDTQRFMRLLSDDSTARPYALIRRCMAEEDDPECFLSIGASSHVRGQLEVTQRNVYRSLAEVDQWSYQRLNSQARRCRRILLVGKRPGPERLLPLRHGVCLDAKELPAGTIGADWTIVDVSRLDTDLSQFRLIENEAYAELLADLRQEASGLQHDR